MHFHDVAILGRLHLFVGDRLDPRSRAPGYFKCCVDV